MVRATVLFGNEDDGAARRSTTQCADVISVTAARFSDRLHTFTSQKKIQLVKVFRPSESQDGEYAGVRQWPSTIMLQ